MTASLSDILTAAKNIVTATNNSARQTLLLAGAQVDAGISANRSILNGQGRLVTVSVTTAGSTTGTIYDVNGLTSNNLPLYTIPMAVGTYQVGLPCNFGLLVTPGTGMVVTVSYSAAGVAVGSQ
jgi:hypothetical protein